MIIDYDNRRSLEFALRGIDVVISTVPGVVQTKIIDAAIRAGVKRFVPAEFEGPSNKRTSSSTDRSLDRGKTAVLQHLQARRSQINSTVFACGVFYERFAPGGLAHFNMGISSPYPREGDYMVNVREMTAQVPYSNSAGQQVFLCMTAASDVAKFIVKALDMQAPWPAELTMRGERMSCYELLTIVARIRGKCQRLCILPKTILTYSWQDDLLTISQLSTTTHRHCESSLLRCPDPRRSIRIRLRS